jgi:Domain of unknown function (DUF932)
MKATSHYFGRVGRDISHCQDLDCALIGADLNFQVVSEPVMDIRGNAIARSNNIARMDNGESLGVNGDRYTLLQTRDAFKYLSALPGECRFQRGGMLKQGRFFLSAKFSTFSVADDLMTAFGVFLSSFDGSWANRVCWVLERHSCLNICRFEIGSATVGASNGKGGRVAKHTANSESKLANFIVALHVAQENLETEVSRLSRVAMSRDGFSAIVAKVVDGESTKSENIRSDIEGYFTREDLGMNGRTAWDAFNAFSAYDTHSATRRETSIASADENAFDSLIAGRGYADRVLPHLLAIR